jgi:hypothetical protein
MQTVGGCFKVVGDTELWRWVRTFVELHRMNSTLFAGRPSTEPSPTWWLVFCGLLLVVWSIRKSLTWRKRRNDPTKFLDDDD